MQPPRLAHNIHAPVTHVHADTCLVHLFKVKKKRGLRFLVHLFKVKKKTKKKGGFVSILGGFFSWKFLFAVVLEFRRLFGYCHGGFRACGW